MREHRLEAVKEKISELFELPKDIVLDLPKVSMIGKNQMYIENHRGIIEYTMQRIRINSSLGVIRISGREMKIRNIGKEEIIIIGEITVIEFLA